MKGMANPADVAVCVDTAIGRGREPVNALPVQGLQLVTAKVSGYGDKIGGQRRRESGAKGSRRLGV